MGTLKPFNVEAVPSPVLVGTEWEQYEALKSDAVPTVPGVPIEKEKISKKNKYENKEENSWLWIPDEKELLKRMNCGKKVILTSMQKIPKQVRQKFSGPVEELKSLTVRLEQLLMVSIL